MLTKFKSNRLGEILVRKGIISHEQLKIAIHEQNHRRKKVHKSHSRIHQSTCLGEILTELKFIDRAQLKRGLSWQLIFRKMTMALALCAPLMGSGNVHAAVSTKTVIGISTKTVVGIPTTVQAENFSIANGIKREVTTDQGAGTNVGSINTGDWMDYTNTKVNIPVTGYYIVSYRVASPNRGCIFTFNYAGETITKIDTVSVPKTGSWQTWVTVERKILLKAGSHHFNIKAVVGGFNLNWFQIRSAPIASSSLKSSVASSTVNIQSSSSLAVASSRSSIKSSALSSSSKANVVSSAAISAKASSLSSESSAQSSAKSSSKSSSSINSLYTHVEGPVGLSWRAPKLREDKTLLDINELGGYQLRYKLLADTKYTYITIADPWTTTYNFSWLEGDYLFQIAAFDKSGVYSDFANFIDN